MKTVLLSCLLCLALLAGSSSAVAQFTESHLPFYYHVHGGLFFPSRENFRGSYKSGSDLLWGFGVAFPINDDFLYLITDLAWFSAQAPVDAPADSSLKFRERFIHVGLLNKVFISKREAVRVQGGLSYSSASETSLGPLAGSVSHDLPKRFGYFGGIGLEHILGGGGLAVYSDILYEYRRSLEQGFSGDFGGIRLEVGVNVNFN